MTSIGVINMIDDHIYIPTTRLQKNAKGKGLNIRLTPLSISQMILSFSNEFIPSIINFDSVI